MTAVIKGSLNGKGEGLASGLAFFPIVEVEYQGLTSASLLKLLVRCTADDGLPANAFWQSSDGPFESDGPGFGP